MMPRRRQRPPAAPPGQNQALTATLAERHKSDAAAFALAIQAALIIISGAIIPGFRCYLLSPSNSLKPFRRRQTLLISVQRPDRTVHRPSSLLILVSGLSWAVAHCSSNAR